MPGEGDTDVNCHVSVKPPEFSEQNASGWFAILEAQFNLAKVTRESTQFFQCLSALPASLVSRLPSNLITEQKYTELKDAILGLVERSKPEIFESLLRTEQLVGKPSVCLSVMQRTASKVGVGDEFIRHKFLNSLPASITPVLAAQTTLNLQQLGSLADQLVAFADAKPAHCAQIQPSHTAAQSSYSSRQQSSSHNRSQSPSNSRQQSHDAHPSTRPFHRGQRPKVCRAHLYYGKDARNCRAWCTWPNKQSCQILANSRPSSPNRSQRRGSECDPNLQGTH